MPATDADVLAALAAQTGPTHRATLDGPACGATADFIAVSMTADEITCPACLRQEGSRTFTITSVAPGYRRDQRPTVATHLLAHEVPGVVVGSVCGRVFGFSRTAGLAVDAEPRPVTCSACDRGVHFDARPTARAPR